MTEPPHEGVGGGRNQWHGQSAAVPVPSFVRPLGGDEVRQGAASVRARCRADGRQERRLAAQRFAGAVQRRRCISRCTDRAAGGCADWHTLATTRARAFSGPDTAEASPRRCAGWFAAAVRPGVPGKPLVRAPRPPATARRRGWQRQPGSPAPLAGQTTVAVTEHAPGLAARSCPHVLGKTARTSGRTGAISGASACCLLGEHGEERGAG